MKPRVDAEQAWFDAQPEAVQTALRKSARTRAVAERDAHQLDKTKPVTDLAVAVCLRMEIKEAMKVTP